MIGSISGQIKAKAARLDPSNYGRSDTSAVVRWFWEIDKVLLLLVTCLIAIGLIAVAAASPAAAHRYSGGDVRFSELYYFWRQLAWIMIGVPVMIGISMIPRERARRLSLAGAAIFFGLLILVPIVGPEHNGARRWIEFGVGQVQTSMVTRHPPACALGRRMRNAARRVQGAAAAPRARGSSMDQRGLHLVLADRGRGELRIRRGADRRAVGGVD